MDHLKQLIADRIYYIRTELLNMTQDEFAKALQLSAQHMVSDYETGLIRPGIRRCQMIIDLANKAGFTDIEGMKIDYQFLRPDQFFKAE